jgi:hypothetical protein
MPVGRGFLMIAIQIILAIIVVYVVYRVCLVLMGRDQVNMSGRHRGARQDDDLKVDILKGYSHMSLLSNKSFSTVNRFSKNFLPLQPSFNRKGGIQFSYTFWMNIRVAQSSAFAWKDIILKGDPQTSNYTVTRFNDKAFVDATSKNTYTEKKSSVAVKCPRIRFGPSYDSFQVELNTLHNPDERFLIRSFSGNTRPSMRNNAIKLAQNKWAMVTFTFEDHTAINDFEDGIIVRFYLNDTLYSTHTVRSAMRTNKSELHLFPSIDGRGQPIQNSRIGNIKYYNRALQHDDVKKLYHRGPPTKPAVEQDNPESEPLFLSEYNKADVYNT